MARAGAGIDLVVAQNLQQGAQFSGSSFPTAPNRVQLHIVSDLNGTRETVIPAMWYKAYGVDAVIVPGRDSPEFWQPHPLGHMSDGVFPLLWDERDTQIYAVPRPARTLAHVIPQPAVVSRVPAGASDTAQAERYIDRKSTRLNSSHLVIS